MILLTLALAACNLSVPDVTPTLAPTRTPSPTPFATNTAQPTVVVLAVSSTPSESPTPTASPTSTITPTPSITPTAVATLTPNSTDTNQPSVTPSNTSTATLTNQPSATPSNTPAPTITSQPSATNTAVPSVTPIPLISTNTPRPTVPPTLTNLPTLTNTPTSAVPPSPTPTRTLSADELTLFATLQFQPVGATVTPAPLEPNLAPTQPPATLDVTPTFITAEAPSVDEGIFTPIPVDTTPEGIAATPTIQPTVALIVTLPPIVTAMPALPPSVVVPLTNTQTRAFALSTNGGVSSTGFNLLNDTTLFARNPVDPNLYVTTDSTGNLYLTGVNGAGAYRPDMSPFSQFYAPSRDQNDSYVSAVAWSPDGRYLAFIVAGRKVAKDGVWFFQPGQFPPIQLMVDCPTPGFIGCNITSNPTNPDLWQSVILRWSPQSDAILVNFQLPGEGRDAIGVIPLSFNERARDVRPPIFRYDFGTWSADGNRILVSGHGEDGHVFVGWINRDGSFSELVYDAEANGLWMGFANPSRSGAIYALGAPGDRGGPREPLRIYNMSGVALTNPIGEGYPQRVEWSPDGSAVFVQSNGRQYIANINGDVREITGQVAGTRAVNWVDGGLPPGESPPANDGSTGIVPVGTTAVPSQPVLPLGVVEGSQYQPGQQLRVYSTELNIRTGPGVAYPFARNFLETGEYVAILAGPVDADGVTWWQVQTADGIVGWIAGEINGLVTLGP